MTKQSLWRGLAVVAALLGALLPPLHAEQAPDTAADPKLEARVQSIAAELRCLVCQNQTVADSQAALAVDLRNEIRQMLARGDRDEQVIEFMTARYGDFVLYRPPVRTNTWLLWFGPLLLLVVGLAGLVRHLKRRTQRPDSDFESDDSLLTPDPERESAP